jgi:hypothetical protein
MTAISTAAGTRSVCDPAPQREQMVEWADAFVVALARDLIEASEFARR